MSDKLAKDNFKKLYQIYYSSFRPPKWIFKPEIWNKLDFKESIIFYNQKDQLEDVIKVATEREPVNIAMKRVYDRKALNSTFGWEISYYGRYYNDHKKLAPNIAIYAKTPVRAGKVNRTAHVLNLIGYAFDSRVQPDYKYFENKSFYTLLNRYVKVWKYAFICAKLKKLTQIHISAVGGGAFAPTNISGAKFISQILQPAIEKARRAEDKSKKIKLIWTSNPEFIVPDSFSTISQKEMNKTLYINAWDPWSMVGNGNEGDNSLDGFWGRSSALAPLCWPLSNPYIKYYPCKL